MNCSRFEKLIALYVEGDLPERKVRLLERHLRRCPACLDFSETLKESQRRVKSLRNESLDETVFQEMRNRVMNEIGFRSSVRRPGNIAEFLGKWGWKPLVAGALLVLVVAFAVWHQHTPNAVSPQVTSKRVDGLLTPVTPAEVSVGLDQKSIDGRVAKKTLPPKAKRPGVRMQNLAIREFKSGFQTALSQPDNIEPKNGGLSNANPDPLVIRWVTDDPDVLIVWLVDQNRGERQ